MRPGSAEGAAAAAASVCCCVYCGCFCSQSSTCLRANMLGTSCRDCSCMPACHTPAGQQFNHHILQVRRQTIMSKGSGLSSRLAHTQNGKQCPTSIMLELSVMVIHWHRVCLMGCACLAGSSQTPTTILCVYCLARYIHHHHMMSNAAPDSGSFMLPLSSHS